MEAQSDYIKDFQRRLQSEYEKAGLLSIPETDCAAGVGDVGAVPRLGLGDLNSFGAYGGYAHAGLSRTPSCPLLEMPSARGAEGSADAGAGRKPGMLRVNSDHIGLRAPLSSELIEECHRPAVSVSFAPDVIKPPPSQLAPSLAGPPDACVKEADAEFNASDVAKEVVRLRLLKKQHDELREQLKRSESQLKRLSPCSVLQFYSYLERHLGDAGLASTVPEAMLKLVECLCALCDVDVPSHKPEGILSSVRVLLREPHSFTSKLCNMLHVSGDQAQGLAPFLLSEVQYKRVRDKEVNACYEAFHGWLSAFYFFSVISDQAAPTAQELDRQEALMRRLSGQEELSRSKSAPALSPRSKALAAPKAEAPQPSRARVSLPGKRTSSVDEAEGSTTPKARGGHASPMAPRGNASPAPRGNTGVTRRTNAPAAPLQSAKRTSAPGPTRMQSDALLSTMRSRREPAAAAPASPSLQPRASRLSVAALGVGVPLPAVPERAMLEAPAPAVFRRSTAPPLRACGGG